MGVPYAAPKMSTKKVIELANKFEKAAQQAQANPTYIAGVNNDLVLRLQALASFFKTLKNVQAQTPYALTEEKINSLLQELTTNANKSRSDTDPRLHEISQMADFTVNLLKKLVEPLE